MKKILILTLSILVFAAGSCFASINNNTQNRELHRLLQNPKVSSMLLVSVENAIKYINFEISINSENKYLKLKKKSAQITKNFLVKELAISKQVSLDYADNKQIQDINHISSFILFKIIGDKKLDFSNNRKFLKRYRRYSKPLSSDDNSIYSSIIETASLLFVIQKVNRLEILEKQIQEAKKNMPTENVFASAASQYISKQIIKTEKEFLAAIKNKNADAKQKASAKKRLLVKALSYIQHNYEINKNARFPKNFDTRSVTQLFLQQEEQKIRLLALSLQNSGNNILAKSYKYNARLINDLSMLISFENIGISELL